MDSIRTGGNPPSSADHSEAPSDAPPRVPDLVKSSTSDDNLPELVRDDNLPEVVQHDYPEPISESSLEVFDTEEDSMKVPQSHDDSERNQPPDASPTPWWRRKRYLLLLVAFATIALASAIAGGTVGSRKRSQERRNVNTVCGGTLCPQILTAAVLGRLDNQAYHLFLFARGVDNAIWWNSVSTETLRSSDGGWPTDAQSYWKPLFGAPFDFLSQPTAVAWGQQSRYVSVAGVTSPYGIVRSRRFELGEDGGYILGDWEDLGGPVDSALAACSGLNEMGVDWFAASGGTVGQNWWEWDTSVEEGDWLHPVRSREAKWHSAVVHYAPRDAVSRPAVVCRGAMSSHDMVVYQRDGTVGVSAAGSAGSWTQSWNGEVVAMEGGPFQGEPMLLDAGGDRLDFFAIGKDAAMRHTTRRRGMAQITMPLSNLGGLFQSVPSAVVTQIGSSLGERVDVVALGADGHLHHRVMQGMNWVLDWEDLGVRGKSAPLLTSLGDAVCLFVVGVEGEIQHAVWRVSSTLSWRDLQWRSMGGNMTTAFH
ncbi:hypothetical protein QBC34DRAFT_499232 [Podospora aff. communis PSN243]|uniref:Fucose-specific lectin n=1 Tax=Podospora aff. communis PSN243 TaxID=3040156 RepID=A0AAV9G7S4_9PEZI|nr:hypothetical protein QBC34DRAFT_499232 [Podospora aff. communis PSN243]